VHFGASAGRADARRRDAGDVVTSSRSGNAADARPPPRPSGLRPAGPLAVLLAPYIPQRVCSSLAPCQRAWGPAAKCTPYFLTGPKYMNTVWEFRIQNPEEKTEKMRRYDASHLIPDSEFWILDSSLIPA